MKHPIFFLFIAFLLLGFRKKDQINVLIITGGHGFNEEAFFEVFKNFEEVEFTHEVQPVANDLIAGGQVNDYDVLVFYDMYDTISREQKKAYLQLLKTERRLIFLHHSLVSYQGWDEFKNIIGGKYHTEATTIDARKYASAYEHDVDFHVKVEDNDHPILKGITDFTIHDEIYENCEILDSVHPLLSTDHPSGMPLVAWINDYGNSEVFYMLLGHGPSAYEDENFRKILKQAIEWGADKD